MRIASLQPSVTVTLRDLGRLELLVACTRYCADACPEVRERDVRIIEDAWTANSEEILAAGPDIVIASVPYRAESVVEIIRSGVRFLGLGPRSLADIYGDLAVIANLVGAESKGDAVIERIQSAIEDVRRKTEGSPARLVFCEEWGKPIIASQSWVAELVAAAGGQFIGEPGKQISAERVHEWQPDVIVAAWCGAGDRVPLEKIVRDRNWTETPAARSGRVFCILDELLNTPASTLIGGLNAIAWCLHPDIFPKPGGIRAIETL